MKMFIGEVNTPNLADSDAEAERLVAAAASRVVQSGGSIDVGRTGGDGPAFIIVRLPDDVTVALDKLVGGGVAFEKVHMTHVPAVPDQGIIE